MILLVVVLSFAIKSRTMSKTLSTNHHIMQVIEFDHLIQFRMFPFRVGALIKSTSWETGGYVLNAILNIGCGLKWSSGFLFGIAWRLRPLYPVPALVLPCTEKCWGLSEFCSIVTNQSSTTSLCYLDVVLHIYFIEEVLGHFSSTQLRLKSLKTFLVVSCNSILCHAYIKR